ncbi:MAG TPA: hypothetical protein VK672_05270 [Solirubrobacteraceae bacterium]|nr:hypothetical protein [Solirubrobacteraceae bacterium]
MRSLQLQAALADFLAQAATALQADVSAGQEVPFELASHSARPRGSSPLYCYRPLTSVYIAERLPALRRLDGYRQAAHLLGSFDGLERYLTSAGMHDRPSHAALSRCDMALLALLHDVFEEQSDFELRPARLDRALERLDSSAFAAAGAVTLVATLHGLTTTSSEVSLTRGLSIAHPTALEGPPEQALWTGAPGEEDHLLVVFNTEHPDPHAAIAQGREVMRELLRALRLFGDGRIALGTLAFARVGNSPWSTIALGTGGHPHGMLLVSPDQEDELRAFCNLVSRRAPHSSEVAWALQRYELGCERSSEYQGLSDHILALRALLGTSSGLESSGSPDGLLAARLAALCATPDERAPVAERTLKALALERHAIAGTAVERAGGYAVARELADHLRALLRDVICGHLPVGLASLADELLLSGEEIEEVGEDADRAPVAERHAGRADTPSGEELLGDRGEPSEILHVAV